MSIEEIFNLVGVVVITREQPSFGTPIFRKFMDQIDYVQSSIGGRIIEKMIPIPSVILDSEDILQVLLNRPFIVGEEFVFGYTDYKGQTKIGTKNEIVEEISNDFSFYEPFPTFQWNFIRLSRRGNYIRKLSRTNIIELHCMMLRSDLRDEESLLQHQFETNDYPERFVPKLIREQARIHKEITHFDAHGIGVRPATAVYNEFVSQGSFRIDRQYNAGDDFTHLGFEGGLGNIRTSSKDKNQILLNLYSSAARENLGTFERSEHLEAYFDIVKNEPI